METEVPGSIQTCCMSTLTYIDISLERRSCEDERERRKSLKVDLFHLQECGSEGKCLARKNMIDVSQFSRAPRAIVAKGEYYSLRILFPNSNEIICIWCSM